MTEGSLKDKTLTGLFWNGVDKFAYNIILFTINIIMARLLSPTDYGLVGIPFYCCFKYPFSCAFCISSCIVCIPICWAIGNISAVALGFISDNFFPTGVS